MKVCTFFVMEEAKDAAAEATEIRSVSSKPSRPNSSRRQTRERKEEPLRPPTFTVNVRLEKPDIIIVENMDSINTDALIFHVRYELRMSIAPSEFRNNLIFKLILD